MLRLFLGEIPDLYSDDEVENIISNVRNEVKSQGLVDNRENCWKFFIERVRRQLKVRGCRGQEMTPRSLCRHAGHSSPYWPLWELGVGRLQFPSDPEHLCEDTFLTCRFKGSNLPPAVPAFLFC